MKKSTAIASLFLSLSLSLYASPVNVSNLATSGDGSSVSPWAGWDTAVIWSAEQEYYFPGGVYVYQTSPNFLQTGIALIGEAGTVLKHTGSGNAVVFDNPGTTGTFTSWTMNVRMENFIIQGNAATTNGLFLRGVRNGIFKHISVRDVSNAGIWTEACVTNILENFRVTHHEMPNDVFNVVPAYGIVLAARGVDSTTTWTITNPVIEGVSNTGILINFECFSNTIINGTVEGNSGKGLVLKSRWNTIFNTDFEANGGTDIEVAHERNTLINVTSSNSLILTGGGANRIIGGRYRNITINSNVHSTFVEGIEYTGTFNDLDDNFSTVKIGNKPPGLFTYDSYIGNVVPHMLQLSSSSGMVNTNCLMSSMFYFGVVADVLLANPINMVNGQKVTWRIQQDGIGGHLISYGSLFRPAPGKLLPVLSVSGNSYDYITAIYNSTRNSWDVQ